MKHHHKSHHVFTFLGALVFIFVVFLGVQYFQVEYSFQDVFIGEGTSAYDEEKLKGNPFATQDGSNFDVNSWQRFGSGNLTFSYPGEYALRIMNGNHVTIIPPLSEKEYLDCNQYTDEQERALCLNPDLSPNITIEVAQELVERTSSNKDTLTINDKEWQRISYQDEYGGEVWYRHIMDDEILQVSYRHADTSGGVSFNTLQETHGDQYQLSASEQNKLALAIMKSIEVK